MSMKTLSCGLFLVGSVMSLLLFLSMESATFLDGEYVDRHPVRWTAMKVALLASIGTAIAGIYLIGFQRVADVDAKSQKTSKKCSEGGDAQ
ncbi:MAG: hypothetical protein ABJL72_04890 [Roseobacter sp.]